MSYEDESPLLGRISIVLNTFGESDLVMEAVMHNLFDISGKVALVTGGRRGLGKAMTLGLAKAGAQVAVVAKSPEADELQRQVTGLGSELFYLSTDLTQRSQRTGLIAKVVEHYGRLDILVNNAGAQYRATALDYATEQKGCIMAKVSLDFSCPTKMSPPFWEEYPSVLIYGAGNVGKDVFRVLTERGIPVIGFLDRKAQGDDAWNGVPILQPDDDRILPDDRKQAGVIIAIHNRDVEIPPIAGRLRASGYGRVITLIELYDWVGKELGDRFWLTSRAYYASLEPFISAAFKLWADETSRELYAAIIKFRLTGDYSVLPAPDREHQYFPPDLPAWKTPLRLVDCGAFDGDTLVHLINAGIPIEAVAAFEPDEINFGKLTSFIRSNKTLKNAALWPCGVYSAAKRLRFTAGQGEAGGLSVEGDVVVQCVSLDEAIPHFAPTLIKMDIEGAEYAALLGARQIIARDRPALAISLYHRPDHLWQIPLLLARWCGAENRFFLRSHGFSGFDLVLYANARLPGIKPGR